jgi:uncharacterized protein YndB with AHSA1/START domain
MPASSATTNELLITQIFDAPRQLVYDAWTKPEHLAHWQGAPEGFTVTFHDVDLRPGGAFRLCMRSPEGVDHWLQGVYREVVEPERLAFTHTWLNEQEQPGPETVVTLTFAELGGKTELTLHQTGFKATQARDGHYSGWTSTLDRFHAYIVFLSKEDLS